MKPNGINFDRAAPWWRQWLTPAVAVAVLGAACAGAVALAQVKDLRDYQDKQDARSDAIDAKVQKHAETLARLDVLVDRLEKAASRIDPPHTLKAPSPP